MSTKRQNAELKFTEFEHFMDHLQDMVFQETCNYLSDCFGTANWGEELHEAHGILLQRGVRELQNRFPSIPTEE